MLAALLLAASLAAPASARAWPDCLHIGAKRKPPRTLTALRSCQKNAARKLAARAEAKGKPLSRAERGALAEHQRAEARRFLARPGVVIEGPPAPAPAQEGTSRAPLQGSGPAGSDGREEMPSEIRAAAETIMARYRAAGVSKIPPDDIPDYKSALEDSKGVITPDIERMIRERIREAVANGDQTQNAPPQDGQSQQGPPQNDQQGQSQDSSNAGPP